MGRGRRAEVAVGLLALAPYLVRLAWPSLYADDVVRITQVRTWPLLDVVRRPFNEHLAPVHGLITWVAWELCGRRLTAAPTAFTVASMVPFPLALAALGWAVWRRTGEPCVAHLAVAFAGLSWLYLDVVANFSGSGFVWALAGSLVALGAAGPGRRGSFAALGASTLAPACSAIGLLAGPVGAVGGWFGTEGALRDRVRAAAWPLAGTALYLVFATSARYGETIARGLDRRIDIGIGGLAAGRAVSNVLPMAIVGGKPAWARPLSWVDAAAGAGMIAAVAVIAWRARRWDLAAAGLMMIGGGYALTYPFRYEGSVEWLLRVDRYHLFPHFGLVLWLALAGTAVIRRWPRLRTSWMGPGVAAVLIALNGRTMIERLKAYDFSEQGRVLKALEELEEICRQEGITREQSLAALEPIRTSWLHPERNGTTVLAMLGPTGVEPRVADAEVRDRLLDRLGAEARAALWGGMDVTRYVVAGGGLEAMVEGVEVGSAGMRPIGEGQYMGRGGSAYVEYELDGGQKEASGLWLSVDLPEVELSTTKLPPVEVWWSEPEGAWSETRRVTWRPTAGAVSGVVPLEVMPHWGQSGWRRVRVAVRVPGTVAIDPPRLVR